MKSLNDLLGKTLVTASTNGRDDLTLTTTCGWLVSLYHAQDGCEEVEIDDICGDLSDLVGSPLTLCEEVVNENKGGRKDEVWDKSYTWTFYKFATLKGYVTVKFYGASNGYYSESVDFHAERLEQEGR